MTVGELRWIELLARGGHEQRGRRPAIIFQTEKASALIPTVLVVPLTSQLEALRFPGTVLIEPDEENRLRRASVALVFQLTALDRHYVRDRIGAASRPYLDEIISALDVLIGRG